MVAISPIPILALNAQNLLYPIFTNTSLFPPHSDAYTTVRVHAGSPRAGDTDHLTGDAPDVTGFDHTGAYLDYDLGKTYFGFRGKIHSGSYRDYKILPRSTHGEPTYISVAAGGSDGVCISSITVTTPSGVQAAWTGDIGYLCGGPYYSQTQPINTTPYAPKCLWLDTHNKTGHAWSGLSFHIPSFSFPTGAEAQTLATQWNYETGNGAQGNNAMVCSSLPRFSMYEDFFVASRLIVFKDKYERDGEGKDDVEQILDKDSWKEGEKPFDPLTQCPGGSNPCFPRVASGNSSAVGAGEYGREELKR